MKDSRKDLILGKIKQYTLESLEDGSFSFEPCSAYYLSLELKLERSNVSRILNSLFQDLLFVKITGRPTLFLSREVLAREFPYAKIPQTLSDVDALKSCLFPGQSKISLSRSPQFDMIGSLPGEALKEITDKVLPVIMQSCAHSLLIILSGEKGCGKKYFCEQVFSYAQKRKIFLESGRLFKLRYTDISDARPLLAQIDPAAAAMLLIELPEYKAPEELYSLNSEIRSLFANSGRSLPVIVFLLDQKEERLLNSLSSLTPCIAHFPGFSERSAAERIKLILTFIQEAADKSSARIHISTELLPLLASIRYTYNMFELKNEIHYAVVRSLYTSGSDSVMLSSEHFSENISRQQPSEGSFFDEAILLVRRSLPSFLDFAPGKPCPALEYLNSSQSASVIHPKSLKSIQELAKRDILSASPSLETETSASSMERLIHSVVAESFLRPDVPLTNRLCTLLEDIIYHRFSLQGVPDDTSFQADEPAARLCSALIIKLELQYKFKFSTACRSYLLAFLHYAALCLNKNNITYLIVTHDSQLNQNYARYLNFISESRSYYTFDYTQQDKQNFDKYLLRITRLLRPLDSSKEFVLVCDRDPLTEISRYLTRNLNLVVMSLYPLNLPSLIGSAAMERRPHLHAVSMLRKLLGSRKEDLAALSRIVTRYPDNYIVSSLGTYFDSFFERNNTILLNMLLFDILKDLGGRMGIPLKAGLVLEFLFHGNFMIARSIEKDMISLQSDRLEETRENDDLYILLRERLNLPSELRALNIPEEEIYVLYTVLKKYK